MRTHLVETIQNLFSWLLFPAKNEGGQKSKQDELREHLLSQYSVAELIAGGEKALLRLEGAKKDFLTKAGRAGDAFAVRHIDPELSLLKEFVQSLREKKKIFPANKESSKNKCYNLNERDCQDVVTCDGRGESHDRSVIAARSNCSSYSCPFPKVREGIGAVELVALVQDEERPLHRIRESAERYACQAILADIAFLRTYPRELLAQVAVSERAATIRKIKKELQTIEKKTEKLLSKESPKEDFYALFKWREDLDRERQDLHDAVLKCVEDHFAPLRPKFSAENGFLYWVSQDVQALSFTQLYEAFQYLFELVKSSEHFRSDVRLLEFFRKSKERFHTVLGGADEYPEEERMRALQTMRLIEEFVGADEGTE